MLRCFLCYGYVPVGVDLRGTCQSDLFKQSNGVSHQSWPMSFALLAYCVIRLAAISAAEKENWF